MGPQLPHDVVVAQTGGRPTPGTAHDVMVAVDRHALSVGDGGTPGRVGIGGCRVVVMSVVGEGAVDDVNCDEDGVADEL